EWESDPASFSQRFAEEDAEIGIRIAEAIVRFPHVVMPAGILRALAELNVSLQVDGHRADLVGRKASQALAAYRGIAEVGVPRSEWESDPASFSQRFAEEDAEIGIRIAEAIVRFPHVVMPAGILRALAELNVSLQVDGHRADLVGRKASQALAAYRGIAEVGVP